MQGYNIAPSALQLLSLAIQQLRMLTNVLLEPKQLLQIYKDVFSHLQRPTPPIIYVDSRRTWTCGRK